MNAPIKTATDKIARGSRAVTVIGPKPPPVSRALLDMIDCSCPPNDGFRAPQAKHPTEKLGPLHFEENASHLNWDHDRTNNLAKAKRLRARTKMRPPNNERAKGPPPMNIREEVYELVRLQGPLGSWEAGTRMARCGYSRPLTQRALEALTREGKIEAKEIAGDAPCVVYVVKEVAGG